jgi:hypothetical protein
LRNAAPANLARLFLCLIKALIKQGFTMNARMQISMAMQLSSELGRMTQSYNTRLAQLLRSHDVTYPQYAVLDHIMRNGTKAETISQISDAVEVLQPAVTKIASDPTSSAK